MTPFPVAEYPHRAVYVVDWDATCVNEVWPGMGDWLPPDPVTGITPQEYLRELSARGKTVIWSLRLHDYEVDDVTPRPPGAVQADRELMRKMLNDAGLFAVSIYPNGRGKPPGRFYIDDRAVRFTSWGAVLDEINERERDRQGD